MGQSMAVEALAHTATSGVWTDASASTRDRVRFSLLDWFAVAIAGTADSSTALLAEVTPPVVARGGRSAHLIGSRRRVPVVDAALVNGVAGHVLDYDDTSLGPFDGHPSAVILPALLALAESDDRSLVSVLDAYTVGVQVADELGSWVSPGHYARGWHATSTVGSVGAAAAAARLMKLRTDGLINAIALAATQAAGVRASFGTMAKPLQVGRAASTATHCALMASLGVQGPENAVADHPAFAFDESVDQHRSAPRHLRQPAVLRTIIKWHASCHGTHAALEALKALDVPPADIEWVEVGVRSDLMNVCGIESPSTPLELKFSIRGVLAMSLAGIDTSDPGSYSERTLASSSWQTELRKVWVAPTELESDWQASVSIGRQTGRTESTTADLRRVPAIEESERRVAEKFERLVAPMLGRTRTDDLWVLLGAEDSSVTEVMAMAGQA